MTKAKRLHWKQGAPASISRYSQAAPTKAGQGPLKFSTTPVEVLEPVFHLFFWNPSSQDFLISPNYKLCFYSMQIPLYHQSLQACGDWSCMIIQGPRQKKVASPRLSTGALAEEAWPELDIGVGIQLLSLWLDDWRGFAWGPGSGWLAQGQDSQDEASDCRAGSGGRCPSLVLWEDECAASGSHLAVGRLRKCWEWRPF